MHFSVRKSRKNRGDCAGIKAGMLGGWHSRETLPSAQADLECSGAAPTAHRFWGAPVESPKSPEERANRETLRSNYRRRCNRMALPHEMDLNSQDRKEAAYARVLDSDRESALGRLSEQYAPWKKGRNRKKSLSRPSSAQARSFWEVCTANIDCRRSPREHSTGDQGNVFCGAQR